VQTWREVTLITACSEELNVGERPRLQLHREGSCEKRTADQWGKKPSL